MKKILVAVISFLVGCIIFYTIKNQNAAIPPGYTLIMRDAYSFQLPANWIDGGVRVVNGCHFDSVANDGGDGHRQQGEIGIYEKSCFDPSTTLGKKEVVEKNGYYIIAYYDAEGGTREDEERETKEVHQNIVSTFALTK